MRDKANDGVVYATWAWIKYVNLFSAEYVFLPSADLISTVNDKLSM